MKTLIFGLLTFSMLAQAQSTNTCKAWQYISNGKAVYCNTCCYGGNCSTSCKQP